MLPHTLLLIILTLRATGAQDTEPLIADAPEPSNPEPVITDSPEPSNPEPVIADDPEPSNPDPVIADDPEPSNPEPVIADDPEPSNPDPVIAEDPEPSSPEPVIADVPELSQEASQEEEESSDWGLNTLRGSFEAVNSYFDSMMELLGGRNGVCQYRCKYGKAPHPRPDYITPEPNGCSSYFLGVPVPEGVDMGIPAMTKCCNQLDTCYDTCGSNKYRCDSKFRWCLHGICSELKKSLGFVSRVEACESVADTLFNTVWTLGCRPFMNSQRAACICQGEERDEL